VRTLRTQRGGVVVPPTSGRPSDRSAEGEQQIEKLLCLCRRRDESDAEMNSAPRDPGDLSNLTTKLNWFRARYRGKFQQHGSLDWFVLFELQWLHGHVRAHHIDDTAVLPPVGAVESIPARPVFHWTRIAPPSDDRHVRVSPRCLACPVLPRCSAASAMCLNGSTIAAPRTARSSPSTPKQAGPPRGDPQHPGGKKVEAEER
jgi:hypothetical protein